MLWINRPVITIMPPLGVFQSGAGFSQVDYRPRLPVACLFTSITKDQSDLVAVWLSDNLIGVCRALLDRMGLTPNLKESGLSPSSGNGSVFQ